MNETYFKGLNEYEEGTFDCRFGTAIDWPD